MSCVFTKIATNFQLPHSLLPATQIADCLFLSVNTVNTHRQRIYRKMTVGNVTGMIRNAPDSGYAPDGPAAGSLVAVQSVRAAKKRDPTGPRYKHNYLIVKSIFFLIPQDV